MGACLASERVALATRQDSRDLGSSGFRCSESETRCNGGAFRDRSSRPWALSFGHPWPNRSLQAPPLPRSLGSVTATGQLHPFRESARAFEFSKERRDRVGPSRTVFGQGWPKRSAARPSLQIPSCPSTGSGHSHLGDGVGRHPITRRVETLTAFQYSIHNVQQLAHAGHDDLFGPLAVRA